MVTKHGELGASRLIGPTISADLDVVARASRKLLLHSFPVVIRVKLGMIPDAGMSTIQVLRLVGHLAFRDR